MIQGEKREYKDYRVGMCLTIGGPAKRPQSGWSSGEEAGTDLEGVWEARRGGLLLQHFPLYKRFKQRRDVSGL